jgi:hypothetical protein
MGVGPMPMWARMYDRDPRRADDGTATGETWFGDHSGGTRLSVGPNGPTQIPSSGSCSGTSRPSC